jgi:hypothetical protein
MEQDFAISRTAAATISLVVGITSAGNLLLRIDSHRSQIHELCGNNNDRPRGEIR